MKTLSFLIAMFLLWGVNAQPLGGSKWTLVSMDDLETGISRDIGATVKATLQFDSDSTYSGKFCTTYTGHFRHNKESAIKMGIPNGPKMICLGIDKYEKEMFTMLTLAHKYRIDKGSLYIFTTSHKRLRFNEAK